MRVEYGLDEIRHDPSSVVTIGTFDGLHLGHQAIMRYLIDRARTHDGLSTVVSFHPHPREVVRNETVPLLTTIEERAELLEELGIHRFIVIPFTKEFSELSAQRFVEDILVGSVGLCEVVIGYDHTFGHDREGDAELLRTMGRTCGFGVDVIPPQVVDAHVVSSTEIRGALAAGDVESAAAMLGRRYGLSGRVSAGDGRGRTIGFPTANIEVSEQRKIVPANGVYAVRVRGKDIDGRPGMMNIGIRPTFGGTQRQLEVHLIDFDGDLYDQMLHVEFAARIRDERRFDGVEDLTKQLSKDRIRCKAALESLS